VETSWSWHVAQCFAYIWVPRFAASKPNAVEGAVRLDTGIKHIASAAVAKAESIIKAECRTMRIGSAPRRRELKKDFLLS
jgi:hypothetical protein